MVGEGAAHARGMGRAWFHIGRVFGDVRPHTVMLEHISGFRGMVEGKVSRREAHRVIKIWRALWRVSAAMGYCQRDADPSLGVRNKEPERRQALWSYRAGQGRVAGRISRPRRRHRRGVGFFAFPG